MYLHDDYKSDQTKPIFPHHFRGKSLLLLHEDMIIISHDKN